MIKQIWGKLTGEIRKRIYTSGTTCLDAYSLSSQKVTPKLAKDLYYNDDDDYKLAAGMTKPVINVPVGFMGVPTFVSEEENAANILQEFTDANTSKMQRTHRNALRDGKVYVWVTRQDRQNDPLYPEEQERLHYTIIPCHQVTQVQYDARTGDIAQFQFEKTHSWYDNSGRQERCSIIQTITPDEKTVEIDGGTPPDIDASTDANPWGFVPVVEFLNEIEDGDRTGRSDFESIEPYLRAYHDVMKYALQGSKNHSTPRLKLKVDQVAEFLRYNFGVDDIDRWVRDGGKINLAGKELIVFAGENEDAEYIEVSSATGDAISLLHLLFYLICETSETPEFAFGARLGANYASVKEQMPVLIRRVARKREFFEEAWQRVARMVLAMETQGRQVAISDYSVTLQWDKIDPRDSKEIAEELKISVDAMADGTEAALISRQSAVDYLARIVEEMDTYKSVDPERAGEREKIVRDMALARRLEDSELAQEELDKITYLLDNE